MRKASLLLFIIVALGINNRIYAQTGNPTATGTMTVQISTILDLSVTNGNALVFNFNSVANLDAGIPQTNATTLTYKSNLPWFINIAANSANFTGGDVNTPMPASVIQYRLNGGGPAYTALSTTAATLDGTTGAKKNRGTGTVGVDFFLNPGYIYGPSATYGMTITYTISNQ